MAPLLDRCSQTQKAQGHKQPPLLSFSPYSPFKRNAVTGRRPGGGARRLGNVEHTAAAAVALMRRPGRLGSVLDNDSGCWPDTLEHPAGKTTPPSLALLPGVPA